MVQLYVDTNASSGCKLERFRPKKINGTVWPEKTTNNQFSVKSNSLKTFAPHPDTAVQQPKCIMGKGPFTLNVFSPFL